MQVFYQVEDWEHKEENIFWECDSPWAFTCASLADVARDCGADIFHNHDGWEAKWPLTILVYESPYKEGFRGRYEVEMEPEPSFFATKV